MELLSGQTIIRTTSLSQQLQSATPFGRYRANFYCEQKDKNQFITTKALPLNILKAPQEYSIKDKVIMLYDMCEYLGELQPENPETAGQWMLPHAPLSHLSISSYHENECKIIQIDLNEHEIAERGENRKSLGLGESIYCRNECTHLLGDSRQLLWSSNFGHKFIGF
ncbi:MAG: hypothetical protein GY787_07600 [Alteromonadales bacterium]|nr:hypothetical protein [Alteromonadales bacterium]